MTPRSAIAILLAVAGLLGAPAGAADAHAAADAQRLLAHVDRLSWELGLPLEDPGALNLRGVDSISEVRFVNADGYQITVLAFGQTVALRVDRRRPSRSAATTYLAHGRATPTSIKASFAGLGRIELHFQHPTGPLRKAPFDGCGPRKRGPVLRIGLFVGGVRLRGEGGYTATAAHRVKGISIDFGALAACLHHRLRDGRRRAPSSRAPFGAAVPALGWSGDRGTPAAPSAPTHPSGRPRRSILLARSKLPLSRTVFAALARGTRDARYIAAEATSEGPIGIVRLVTAAGPPSSFVFADSLASARVAPPPPFSGRGVFEHGAGSAKSWTGSLAVSFLGAPHVALTGEPFGTELIASW
jgi:hypothetical protein